MAGHQRPDFGGAESGGEVKQLFKLTHDELMAVMAAFEKRSGVEPLWRGICKRVGCSYETVEDAKSGDPHDFLAEPVSAVAAVAISEDVRKGATSASNALADSLCPGRHLAQKGLPEPERSEDAQMGTRIHNALAKESGVLSALSLAERDMFDSCRDIEHKIVAQFFGGEPETAKGYRVFRHERLWLPNSGKPGFFAHSGEPDAVFRMGTKALVADYKVLTGDVADASSNQQLRDLAVLVAGAYPPLDQVATVIIQPLVTHSPEVCLYTLDDLTRAYGEMVGRVKASNDPKSPRVAGEVQCKFCKAKTKCPEFNRWQGSLIPVAVIPDDLGMKDDLFSVAMANWTPDQRALVAGILPIATKRLDEIAQFLKGLLKADDSSIPGWQLKAGNTRETITDPQGVFDRFAALGGKLPQFFPCVKIEKGKLAEAMAEVTGAKGQKLKSAMGALLEGFTESKQNQPSLERVGEK